MGWDSSNPVEGSTRDPRSDRPIQSCIQSLPNSGKSRENPPNVTTSSQLTQRLHFERIRRRCPWKSAKSSRYNDLWPQGVARIELYLGKKVELWEAKSAVSVVMEVQFSKRLEICDLEVGCWPASWQVFRSQLDCLFDQLQSPQRKQEKPPVLGDFLLS